MSQWEKIYGIHAVEALLNHHPKRVKQLFILEGRQDPKIQHIIELAKKIMLKYKYLAEMS